MKVSREDIKTLKKWAAEQIKNTLLLVGAFTVLCIIEAVTFTVLGIE